MADLLIEDVDEETLRRLKERAKEEGLTYYEVVHRALVASLDCDEGPARAAEGDQRGRRRAQ